MSIHPGAWLLWTLCAGLVALSTTNPFYLAPLCAAAWCVHAAQHRPGPGIRSFRIFAIFGLVTICTRTALVLLGPIGVETVLGAALEGARLAVLLTIYGTFNSVSDPWRVLRLTPRRFHEPALAAVLALSIAPRFIDSAGRVREAQRLRGINLGRVRALPALAVPVLATGMEDAVTLAESMDARGHGSGRRTRYRREPWTIASALTAGAGLLAVIVTATIMRAGEPLSMPLYPPVWPEVSPLILAAIAALALPSLIPIDASEEQP